jgi:hypothetical protein
LPSLGTFKWYHQIIVVIYTLLLHTSKENYSLWYLQTIQLCWYDYARLEIISVRVSEKARRNFPLRVFSDTRTEIISNRVRSRNDF